MSNQAYHKHNILVPNEHEFADFEAPYSEAFIEAQQAAHGLNVYDSFNDSNLRGRRQLLFDRRY